MKHFLVPLIPLLLWSVLMSSSSPTRGATIPVYLASPAKDGGGIYLSQFDTDSGKLSTPQRLADPRVSFLALHPSEKFLYGVGNDRVYALAVDGASNNLSPLNDQPCGRGPCYVSVDPAGRNTLVANYGGGTVSVVPIKDDGTLAAMSCSIQHTGSGPNKKRQDKPHAHSIDFDPTGKLVLAADLGTDKLMLYRLDAATGKLTPADPPHVSTPPGGGPRHFDFHPNGKFLYVNNEMGMSVTAFAYDGAGGFQEVQTVPTIAREPTDADTTSQIQVHPTGKFLYVANRGPNDIAAFSIDESSGKLTLIGHTPTEGQTPRHFTIDPTAKWLLVANQDGDNVVVLRIDPQSGALAPTGQAVKLDQPMCVLFP